MTKKLSDSELRILRTKLMVFSMGGIICPAFAFLLWVILLASDHTEDYTEGFLWIFSFIIFIAGIIVCFMRWYYCRVLSKQNINDSRILRQSKYLGILAALVYIIIFGFFVFLFICLVNMTHDTSFGKIR